MNYVVKPILDRLLSRTKAKGDCLVYTGGKLAFGYGAFEIPSSSRVYFGFKEKKCGVTIGAHRAIWIIKKGPILDNLKVCHTCDNPPCVKLEHLFLGTSKDNTLDAKLKGRLACGEKSGQAKLTGVAVEKIRILYETKCISQEQLAKAFNVDQAAIWSIIKRKTWRTI